MQSKEGLEWNRECHPEGRVGDIIDSNVTLRDRATGKIVLSVDAWDIYGGDDKHFIIETPVVVSPQETVVLIEDCLAYYDEKYPKLVPEFSDRFKHGFEVMEDDTGLDIFRMLRLWIDDEKRLEKEIFSFERPLSWDQIERHLRTEHTDFEVFSKIGIFCYGFKDKRLAFNTYPEIPMEGIGKFISNVGGGRVTGKNVRKAVSEAGKLFGES